MTHTILYIIYITYLDEVGMHISILDSDVAAAATAQPHRRVPTALRSSKPSFPLQRHRSWCGLGCSNGSHATIFLDMVLVCPPKQPFKMEHDT